MAKKRKNQKTKSNIGSSSLLPARHDGDKPDLPFSIKTEPVEDPSTEENLSIVETSKHNRVICEDAEILNHSDTSAATEPMETGEGTINGSSAEDHVENQVVPASFEQVHVKTEHIESEVADNQESRVGEFVPNGHVDNSPTNEALTPVVNGLTKEEPVENSETCQDINDEEMINTTVYTIKTEPTTQINENAPDLQNYSNEKLPTKRKLDTKNHEEKIQEIRKRIKTEPIDDQNLSVLLNENHEAEKNGDDTETEEIIDSDIAVLPVPKVQKIIDVVTISDGEVDDQSSESQNTSTINLPKKTAKKRDFSVAILKYFNVVSELDRHDCQTSLDLLSNYKTTEIVQKLLPVVKKEEKAKRKILKGDILFRNILTETDSDKERVATSVNVGSNFLNKSPIQHASQNVNVPVQHAASNLSTQKSVQHVASKLSTQKSDLLFTVPELQNILKMIRNSNSGQNLSLDDKYQNSSIPDPQQNMSIQDPQQHMALQDLQQNMTLQVPHPNMTLQDLLQNAPLQYTQQNISLQDVHKNSSIPDLHQNLQLHDPRLRKKARLENGNTIQVINPTLIPSQPVASLPSQGCQRFPRVCTSSPDRVSCILAPPSMPKEVSFPSRKGSKDLLLYHNVGQDDIIQHFETLILQWNPSWLEIQKKTGVCPPISQTYRTVGYSYQNEMDYYNTYVPLHLLHVWYSIYQCWERNEFTVIGSCKVQSIENLDNGSKISCSVELEETQVWPKRDDIIWCKHNMDDAFLLVEDVRKRPTNLSRISKLKISLKSLHDLKLKLDDELSFYILLNIRTAYLQTEALNSLDNSMKELVLKPESYSSCIGIIKLDGSKRIKEQRNAVFKILISDEIRIIVIEAYHNLNQVQLFIQLTYNIVYNPEKFDLVSKNGAKKQLKVLIIVRSNEVFNRLYRNCCMYKPVLVVRTKQIMLDPELIKHTLEYRLDRKENLNDILNNHHIFLTIFSAFGSAEKTHLSKLKNNNMICIIDEAHLCTEVETSLPLTLKIKKLLLIGLKHQAANLPDFLRHKKYDISLFDRLSKAKHQL